MRPTTSPEVVHSVPPAPAGQLVKPVLPPSSIARAVASKKRCYDPSTRRQRTSPRHRATVSRIAWVVWRAARRRRLAEGRRALAGAGRLRLLRCWRHRQGLLVRPVAARRRLGLPNGRFRSPRGFGPPRGRRGGAAWGGLSGYSSIGHSQERRSLRSSGHIEALKFRRSLPCARVRTEGARAPRLAPQIRALTI